MRSEPLESSADLSVVDTVDAEDADAGPADREAEVSAAADHGTPGASAGIASATPASGAVAAPPVTASGMAARRRSGAARFFGEVPLMLVICGVGLGLVVIAMHHFRWGSLAISVSVMAGSLLRLVLPTRKAGLLVVRSRFTDVVTTGLIGGALLVLAAVTST